MKFLELTSDSKNGLFVLNLNAVEVIHSLPDGKTIIKMIGSDEFIICEDDFCDVVNAMGEHTDIQFIETY